jgi:hypothetical protein
MATQAGDLARAPSPTATASVPAGGHGPHPAVHRLRDLDRRARWTATAFAAALVLSPLVALAIYLPGWGPSGDPALMALRALDVGTADTPLLGQPSSSGVYSGASNVHHLGPLHFYLLAVPVRALGGAAGMLVVSVAITGTCLVTSAWAVFRQLGRTAGVIAALTLATIAFTTGASALVNPVSSSIAGYPLLLSAVLLWCVACGDLRLLPAATAAVSFTAQQHLSVVIATGVITAGGLALLAATAWSAGWHRDPATRRALGRAVGAAGVVAAVLWTPPLAQQAVGDDGNLGRVLGFAADGNEQTLGPTSAVWQVVHVLGFPPLLGRTDLIGFTLLTRPRLSEWAGAAVVAACVAWSAWRWRSTHPRRARLGAMTGVVAVAGLLNGSSVPVGLEQFRLAFYHWAWPLSLFVVVVLGLAAVDAVRHLWPSVTSAFASGARARRALTGLAVVAVAAPALVNPTLDRRTNTLPAANQTFHRDVTDELVDGILAHRGEIGERTVLLARNEPIYTGVSGALAFGLIERGLGLRLTYADRRYVADSRLVDRVALDGALVVVYDQEVAGETPAGGELIAEVAVGDRGPFGSEPQPDGVRAMRVFLLDRAEALEVAYPGELTGPRAGA